jgi:hypothetical protein
VDTSEVKNDVSPRLILLLVHDTDLPCLAHLPALILVESHAYPAPAAFANASAIHPLFAARWFTMLSKKIVTAYGLFRNGGVKKVYDYSWHRLQMLARVHMRY